MTSATAGIAGKTEPCCHLAFGHLTVPGEPRFFRVLDDEQIECRCVGQDPAHHQRVGNGAGGIGEGKCARFRQYAELGQLSTFEAAGDRAIGIDFDDVGFTRPARNKFDDRDIVDCRVGIR